MKIHMSNERSKLSSSAQARMAGGTQVGLMAQDRYPGGVLAPYFEVSMQEACRQTQELLEHEPPAVYEASFCTSELYARSDILVKVPDGWKIVEVKASGSANKDYFEDVAFQVLVARVAGVPIKAASILHFNKEYVWPGGDYDPEQMFTETDITKEVEKLLNEVGIWADRFLQLWTLPNYPPLGGTPPHCDPGLQSACRSCDFGDHCRSRSPEDHIFYMGLHSSLLKKLRGDGTQSISDIPEGYLEKEEDLLRLNSWKTRSVHTSPALGQALAEICYPAYLIDFETLRPDIPVLQNTSPFELFPFQWSSHRLDGPPIGENAPTDITQGHSWFLHQEQSDPRYAFCRSLYELLKGGGSILVYSPYEASTIKAMVDQGIPYAEEIFAWVPSRFIDLEKIVRGCIGDYRFKGQTSIKAVLPAIAPNFSYKSLEIQGGDQAQIQYQKCLTGAVSGDEAKSIYDALLEYCRLDTWAMVELLKEMVRLSDSNGEINLGQV